MNDINLLIPDDFGRGDSSPRPDSFTAGQLSGETMGTTWSAKWFAPAQTDVSGIAGGFDRCFAGIIAAMSSWETGSQVSCFNRLPAGATMDVSDDFAAVMRAALDVARRSGGAFDPCLGSEVVRRGFGPVGIQVPQTVTSAGAALWDSLIAADGRLFQPGGVVLDLSAIAKGYAVDRMADVLKAASVTQFLVEIGGEFVGQGVKPDGSPWWVDLENPGPGNAPWRVALCGHALATSGDYRQMRSGGEGVTCHIVPSDNRRSAFGDLASVSVLHTDCAIADAWATALFAAGDDGLAMADREGLAALFQYRDAAPRLSARMTALAN